MLINILSISNGISDFISRILARFIGLLDLHDIVESHDLMRLVFVFIPNAFIASLLGSVTGVIIGYAIRKSENLRAIMVGCGIVLGYFVIYPAFRFAGIYGEIIKSEVTLNVDQLEQLKAVELMAKGGIDLMLINCLALVFILIFAFLSRRVYLSRKTIK
jgi:hypothetical protein